MCLLVGWSMHQSATTLKLKWMVLMVLPDWNFLLRNPANWPHPAHPVDHTHLCTVPPRPIGQRLLPHYKTAQEQCEEYDHELKAFGSDFKLQQNQTEPHWMLRSTHAIRDWRCHEGLWSDWNNVWVVSRCQTTSVWTPRPRVSHKNTVATVAVADQSN